MLIFKYLFTYFVHVHTHVHVRVYLDIFSLEVGDLVSEPPRGINRTHHRLSLLQNAILEGHTEIVLTKAGSLVDHARTTLTSHVGVTVRV